MKPDLNLLRVFHAIARTGSVTLAADRLGLSQPAVSHALRRLRAQVGDVLFLPVGRGLVMTPHAQGMVVPVEAVLAAAGLIMAAARFDPRAQGFSFQIGVSDYAALTIIPAVMRAVEEVAPGVTLRLMAVGEATLAQMERAEMCLSFWGAAPVAAPFHHQRLFAEEYVGVARAGHAIFDAGVTLAGYLAQGHVVVSLGDPGANAVDSALRRVGQARRVRLLSPSFAGCLAVVRQTDLVTVMPRRMWAAGGQAGLQAFDVPLDVPGYDYGMVWHARTDASPAHVWLRGVIAAAV